jgi:predicted outer membrane repeat protein
MRLLPLLLVAACATPGDTPTVEVSPATLDLGEVPLGETRTGSLTLLNQGPGIARIATIALADDAGRAWALEDVDTTDLFAGATSELAVAFTPGRVGLSQTRLLVRSNDPDTPTLGIPLSATGVQRTPGGDIDPGAGTGAGTGGDTAVDDDGDGLTEDDGDCDDGDAAVFPGATEACDGADEDCSGVVDDLDADADGHSPCDAAGDCDDTDPAAFPVVVAAATTAAERGTVAAPYATLGAALDALDATCRTVVLLPGTHTVAEAWESGAVTIRGATTAAEVVLTPPAGSRALTVGEGGRLTLEALTLAGARGTAGDGGALYVEGEATLVGVRAVDNRSTGDGGAVAVHDGTLTLRGCSFSGNEAATDGGALYTWDATVTDDGSAWTENAAHSGGAVVVQQSRFTTIDGTWTGNTADGSGGALILRGGAHDLARGTFTDNVAGGDGGAILVDDTASGALRNLLVVANRAGDRGGGVSVRDTPGGLVIANSTLVGNDARGAGGGVSVATRWSGVVDLVSLVVAGSGGTSGVSATTARGELWEGTGDTGRITVAYTLASGNAGEDLSLEGGTDGGDNLIADPLFTAWTDDGDATNDTYTLAPGSPAIDAGPEDGYAAGDLTDWSDPDGSRNDRGATGGLDAG